jgi:hypothetical protein
MLLNVLAAFISMSSPTTCATIYNGENVATWTHGRKTAHAFYTDQGDPQLKFDRRVPVQVRMAEEALQYGKPGRKTITVCS